MTASRALALARDLAGPGGDHAHAELVEHLRALLRLRTVNPPGDEILAARYLAAVLGDAGLEPEILEPSPGRGSVVARLRGNGTGGGPLLLLAHTDVVPVDEERWTHDPFGGEVADGYVWGRGAVDMKSMVAMELEVVLLLARAARAAGRDPARDPVPGLRRDVIFAATADEEAGGFQGAGWIADHLPELLQADGALTETGGVSVELLGRRFYPIQVAEKGFEVYRVTVRGTPGHGSVPREDNAAVLAARVAERLAAQGKPRATAVMEEAIRSIAAAVPARRAAWLNGLLSDDDEVVAAALETLCEEPYRRTLAALLHDTVSPNQVHAGVKYNIIPGSAWIELDCRLLPGTSVDEMTARLRERIGGDLLPFCEIEPTLHGDPVEQPTDTPLYRLLGETLRAHDPEGIPIPIMAPFATDAKHLARLGVPTYGFAPLRLGPRDAYLDLFHADDERVPLDALRFGLPVLYDVVRRYCTE